MRNKEWARLLAYVTGLVNQQLLLQNEYLAAENRILRGHLPTRLRLTNPQRYTLAEIGKLVRASAYMGSFTIKRWNTLRAWLNRTASSGGIGD